MSQYSPESQEEADYWQGHESQDEPEPEPEPELPKERELTNNQ